VIEPTPDTIPARLRANPWVLWAAEPDLRGGKPRKVPRMIADPSRCASSTDPATWGAYDDAVEVYAALTADPRWAPLRIAGVGCVLIGDGLVCVDFDGCIIEGSLAPAVATIVRATPSFTEVSASGTGLHLWVLGTLARALVGGKTIEAYDRGRYIAVTGQRWPGTPPDVEPAPRLCALIDEMSQDDDAPRPAPRSTAGPVRVRRQMPIVEGTRDTSLYRIASGLVQDGARGAALLGALREANARLCQPPLPERDVRRIARSAERRS
jgi:hypothetical protein